MSIGDQLKIQQLEEQVKLLTMSLTQTTNIIRAAVIEFNEGDYDSGMDLLKELIRDEAT
jgi:hypothetical protein